MVTISCKHNRKKPVPQASQELSQKPHKISSSTRYDFQGKNLTPYGGLFPVATMLEKLGFQKLRVAHDAATRCLDGTKLDRHEYILKNPDALPELDVSWG